MRNKYILLEMNQRNEIRADVNMRIKNIGLTEIENMNVKLILEESVLIRIM